jgi:hypothetical protein
MNRCASVIPVYTERREEDRGGEREVHVDAGREERMGWERR